MFNLRREIQFHTHLINEAIDLKVVKLSSFISVNYFSCFYLQLNISATKWPPVVRNASSTSLPSALAGGHEPEPPDSS